MLTGGPRLGGLVLPCLGLHRATAVTDCKLKMIRGLRMIVGHTRGWGICRNLNSTADLVKSAGDQGSGYRLHPKHLIFWV